MEGYGAKKLVLFDLDGTLAVSKSPLDEEMAGLLHELLGAVDVAVISGGSYKQFTVQFLGSLNAPEDILYRLHLFPTCATSFYRYLKDGGWTNIYSEILSSEQKKKIFDGFDVALRETGFRMPETMYGDLIEDRLSQVTFSAFGQKAPIEIKRTWDPDGKKRLVIAAALGKYLPEFEIRVGGTTSIDVTRPGIDKAYGIRQIEKHLNIPKDKMLFVGDALFEGGNDYPVKAVGVDCVEVGGPEDTKTFVRNFLRVRGDDI